MPKSLSIKFLVLLLAVSLIALSAAFFLRELIISDFGEYLEGEMEDRVHWVTADLEGAYEKHSGWKEDVIAEDTIWALMLGMEIKVLDMDGAAVMDTEKAVGSLSPLMKRRIMAVSKFGAAERPGKFQQYPLFLGGKEVGRLEVRLLQSGKEAVFIRRADRFLLLSLFALGGLAVILSIVFSRKLTDPIKKLTSAARAIGGGDLKSRVSVRGPGSSVGGDEIGELSDTFNRMAHALEIQESLRKRLISNVAHELRTPISAMRGELEGVLDGLIPMDREHLKSLHEETGRLKDILDGIEDLSHAQASALTLRKQRVELGPFLKNIGGRFEKAAIDKGITIDIGCEDGLAVNADPDRLSQVVINLLSNAVRATGEGGSIRITAGKAGKESSEVFIGVTDTGQGIAPEDLPFIFERFYRGPGGGLGLGLAIAKELVEAHGGRISARSVAGEGASVTFCIPG